MREWAAVFLAAALATGCTQGFPLGEDSLRSRELTQAKFVFSEGNTLIEMGQALPQFSPTVAPSPLSTPESRPAPKDTPTIPSLTQTPRAAIPALLTQTPRAAILASPALTTTTTPEIITPSVAATTSISSLRGDLNFDEIAANMQASVITIPSAKVDPELITFQETTDIRDVFSPEFPVRADLISFAAVFGGRQPGSTALSELQRLVHLYQLVFVHDSMEAADDFHEFLSTRFIEVTTATRVTTTQELYPDLEVSVGHFDEEIQIADEVTFAVLLMNQNVSPDAPIQGGFVPVTYFITVRDGRMTAVLEVGYLAEQNPNGVLQIVSLLTSRTPPHVRATAAS